MLALRQSRRNIKKKKRETADTNNALDSSYSSKCVAFLGISVPNEMHDGGACVAMESDGCHAGTYLNTQKGKSKTTTSVVQKWTKGETSQMKTDFRSLKKISTKCRHKQSTGSGRPSGSAFLQDLSDLAEDCCPVNMSVRIGCG